MASLPIGTSLQIAAGTDTSLPRKVAGLGGFAAGRKLEGSIDLLNAEMLNPTIEGLRSRIKEAKEAKALAESAADLSAGLGYFDDAAALGQITQGNVGTPEQLLTRTAKAFAGTTPVGAGLNLAESLNVPFVTPAMKKITATTEGLLGKVPGMDYLGDKFTQAGHVINTVVPDPVSNLLTGIGNVPDALALELPKGVVRSFGEQGRLERRSDRDAALQALFETEAGNPYYPGDYVEAVNIPKTIKYLSGQGGEVDYSQQMGAYYEDLLGEYHDRGLADAYRRRTGAREDLAQIEAAEKAYLQDVHSGSIDVVTGESPMYNVAPIEATYGPSGKLWEEGYVDPNASTGRGVGDAYRDEWGVWDPQTGESLAAPGTPEYRMAEIPQSPPAPAKPTNQFRRSPESDARYAKLQDVFRRREKNKAARGF